MSRAQSNNDGEAAASSTGSKVRADRVALLVLSALLAAAAVVIYRLSFEHFQAKKNLQRLKDENEAMRKRLRAGNSTGANSSVLVKHNLTAEPGPTCDSGWEQHGGKCYYFSTNKLTWTQSRSDCKGRGADLVLIDSEKEQSFLAYRVRAKMNHDNDMFWIGLTDSEEEGTWLWVDGSALNKSCSFWFWRQPDDWKGSGAEGEDCVRMGPKEGAEELKCWYDRFCNNPQRRICEKEAAPGSRTHVLTPEWRR